MKRNFTLLTILGALIAMAVPASAMAVSINPASHKFEVASVSTQISTNSLTTSYCNVGKLTGTIPAAPNNQGATVTVPISTPATSSCNGESVTFSGAWSLVVKSPSWVWLKVPVGGMVVRYTSLPGCKLTSTSTPSNETTGIWSNGTAAVGGTFTPSAYHTHGGMPATWSDDGATCALAGQSELIHIGAPANVVTVKSATVNDTTNPSVLITVTG